MAGPLISRDVVVRQALERAALVLRTARHYDGPLVQQTRGALADAIADIAASGERDVDTLANEALRRVVGASDPEGS